MGFLLKKKGWGAGEKFQGNLKDSSQPRADAALTWDKYDTRQCTNRTASVSGQAEEEPDLASVLDTRNQEWKLPIWREQKCQDLEQMKKRSGNLYSTQYERKSNYSIIDWTELSCKRVGIRHY